MDKRERALARLVRGQRLFQMPSGQWKFGGNKFVPDNVALSLPVEPEYVNNMRWTAHWLTDRAQKELLGIAAAGLQ